MLPYKPENVCFGLDCITFRDTEVSKFIFKAKMTFLALYLFISHLDVMTKLMFDYMNSMKIQ